MHRAILGHRPTVATATIHVDRRLLQCRDGGGGNQTDHHVVKIGNGNVRALRDRPRGPMLLSDRPYHPVGAPFLNGERHQRHIHCALRE
jgi:hypothetical protein